MTGFSGTTGLQWCTPTPRILLLDNRIYNSGMFSARRGVSCGLSSNRAGNCRSFCCRILLALSISFALEARSYRCLPYELDSAAGMTFADRQKLRQALAAYDEG